MASKTLSTLKQAIFIFTAFFSFLSQSKAKNAKITFDDWAQHCITNLPEHNRGMPFHRHHGKLIPNHNAITHRGIAEKTFENILDAFAQKFSEQKDFTDKNSWQKKDHANHTIKNFQTPDKAFEKFFDLGVSERTISEYAYPFAQKIIVPAGSNICFMGDLHGSVHSLVRNLSRLVTLKYLDNNWNSIKPNFYMVFTGDYGDRGRYSAEVWYTLIQLKLANWDNVFLLRGNHETKAISSRFGYYTEINKKFRSNKTLVRKATNIFRLLPMALYVGSGNKKNIDFIQCCHGGIHPKTRIKYFLRSDTKFLKITDNGDGFLWSDFHYGENPKDVSWGNRGVYTAGTFSIGAAKRFLELNELKAFFRGHQHDSYGLKMFCHTNKYLESEPEHWKKIVSINDQKNSQGFLINNYTPVFTFSSASEGVSLPYDCFAILTTAQTYDRWRLNVFEYKL